MVRVVIADDHAVVRKGLKAILTTEIPGLSCSEATNAQEVRDEVEHRDCDLVILDISMPGRSGLDVLKDIKHLRPKLPVLVLSFHPETLYGTHALLAGASGYLNKDSASDELVRAVKQVLAGRRYVSPAMAESLAAHVAAGSDRLPHESLSCREFEILRMIGTGKTTARIAGQLHLSPTTISTYRARILAKMKMATTSELIYYVLSNHLTG